MMIRSSIPETLLRTCAGLLLCAAPFLLNACIVIPVGDLLKGPALAEQVLEEGDGVFSKEKIAIIDVSGVISGTAAPVYFGGSPSAVAEIKAQLDWAASDSEVRAVVLRISSPGGEVTACDMIHREILKLRTEYNMPVVASIQDIGASGGLYIACGADRIFANPTAIVGSIGVILQGFDLSGLLQKLGVDVTPVKSSQSKDLNSIFRGKSDKEVAILQKLVDDLYQRFVDIVETNRSELDREAVLKLADGRVVSGTEAASVKLIDEVGYLEDAIAYAAKIANIDSPTIVRYTRKAQVGSNIYTQHPSAVPAGGAELTLRISPESLSQGRLHYLWRP